ncbi:MAG: hypothetical protein QXQ91_04420 [Nanopusillaceae archaeon]
MSRNVEVQYQKLLREIIKQHCGYTLSYIYLTDSIYKKYNKYSYTTIHFIMSLLPTVGLSKFRYVYLGESRLNNKNYLLYSLPDLYDFIQDMINYYRENTKGALYINRNKIDNFTEKYKIKIHTTKYGVLYELMESMYVHRVHDFKFFTYEILDATPRSLKDIISQKLFIKPWSGISHIICRVDYKEILDMVYRCTGNEAVFSLEIPCKQNVYKLQT